MESLLASTESIKSFLEDLALPSSSSNVTKKLETSLVDMYSSSVLVTRNKFGQFDNLIVENLDVDSIWEEIRSRCDPLAKYLDKKISSIESRLITKGSTNFFDDNKNSENEQEKENSEDEVDYLNKDDDDDDNDFRDEDEGSFDDKESEVDDDASNIEYNDDDNSAIKDKNDVEFDDPENDMEEYLDQMERDEMTREAKLMRKEASLKGHKSMLEYEDDTEEDDFDYIQRVMYQNEEDDNDDDEEEDETLNITNGRGIMYEDFFGTKSSKKTFKNKNVFSDKNSSNNYNGSGSGTIWRKGVDQLLEKGNKIKEENNDDDNDYYHDKKHTMFSDNDENDNDDEMEEDENDFDEENFHDDYINDDDNEEDNAPIKQKKKDLFDNNDADDDEEEEADDSNKPVKKLTKFQKMQLSKQQEINSLETEIIGKKSWDMRGEVKASDRPENSLLELAVDIERASKPAPLITETYTNTIEEMILKRILAEQYDDVVPKEGQDMDNHHSQELEDNGEGIPEVSQEKSKLGLGEVYANEYLLRAGHQTMSSAAANEAEDVLRKTVKGLFHKICRDLDSLSNFYFTPKPVAIEGSITATPAVPAILLEDIAPYRPHNNAAANDNTLSQGPSAIYNKKRGREGELQTMTITHSELSQEERKRLRSSKKQHKRQETLNQKMKDQNIAKGNTNSYEYSKLENEKTDNILKSDKRVSMGKMKKSSDSNNNNSNSKGSSGGSSHFFEHLQNQISDEIQRKSKSSSSLKKQNNSSSSTSNAPDYGKKNSNSNIYKL